MTDIFGIDLGTTYSAIAYINENGLPEIIRNTEGNETTPSVVFFENDENVVIGQEAKNTAVVEPELTVSLIKRLMGREFHSEYHGVDHTPESISSLILKQLVAIARETTGIDSNRVIITVPAYFGVLEKEATRTAGEIAGLDVVGIVTEPVAAALSYGYTQEDVKTIFVYDLGGGTFDTTILQTGQGRVDVLVIDGDGELGGADWDLRLIDHLASQFQDAAGLADDPLEDDDFRQELTEKAEAAKKTLSAKDSTPVVLGYAGKREKIEVTREEFERLTADLLEQTMSKVQATFDAAQEKVPGLTVDTVLLVGGSSKMPAVRQTLSDRFGLDPLLIDPDLAVAKGAAIYGTLQGLDDHSWAGHCEECARRFSGDGSDVESAEAVDGRPRLPGGDRSAIPVRNVLPKGLGVLFFNEESNSDYIGFLHHKNGPVGGDPVEITAVTLEDRATSVAVRLFEQSGEVESERVEDNKELSDGGLTFTNLPSLAKGSPIEIALGVDSEGLVTLAAHEPTSGQRLSGQIKVRTMPEEEKQELMEQIARITPRD